MIKILGVIKDLKISRIPCVRSDLESQKKSTILVEFLEKVISGEDKLTRATSYAKNRLSINLSTNFASKYEEKDIFPSVECG